MEFRDIFKAIIVAKDIDKFEEIIPSLHSDIDNYIGDRKNECVNIGIDGLTDSNFDYSLFDEDFKNVLSDFCISCGDFRIVNRINHQNTRF